jgi:quinoprotein glucose dehydrogenase
MYFQYLSDRGPWNRERMWHPYEADEETTRKQPAYIVPPVRNVSDGPSGLVYYPGVGLPERYKGHFFLADFRGSSARSGIRSFAVEPRGATFKLVDEHWFLEQILATDVDFGYDGKMYVTDWVDGWTGPGKGRIYTFFDPEHRKAAEENNVAELFRAGFDHLKADRLAELLDHPDRRVRQEAQFALASDYEVTTLTQLAKSSPEQLVRVHAIWGLWQIGRRQSADEIQATLLEFLNDDDAEIRAQAIRVLGEIGGDQASKPLQEAVAKGTAREQYFAAIALGRLGDSGSVAPLIGLLSENANEDPVLRHAAVMGLVGSSNPGQLMRFADSDSAAVRLGLVLALRRLHSADVAAFLRDEQPAVVEEAARAIHDLPIAAALPALAALAEDDLAAMSDALRRRVLNANYRLGGPQHARFVAKFAISDAVSEALQKEAVFALLNWDKVPVLDRVTNEHRPLPTRSADAARDAVRSSLGVLLSGNDALRADAARLAAKYTLQDAGTELLRLVQDDQQPGEVRAEALAALHAIGSPDTAAATERALASKDSQPRLAAYRVLAATAPERAAKVIDDVLGNDDASVEERQQAIAILASSAHDATNETLLEWLNKLANTPDQTPPEIRLDLIEAASGKKAPAFQEQLAKIEAARDPNDPLAAVRNALVGGNADRGREVFFGNAAASCRRCHKVNGEGSDVGPDLSGIGKQQTREYILEAITLPNAKIAKGFETVIFVLDDGRTYTGIVKGEDDASYQLMTAQGEIVRVPKESIDFQSAGRSGMPDDVTKSLTRSDIRDLVEYLSTLQNPVASAEAHGKSTEEK